MTIPNVVEAVPERLWLEAGDHLDQATFHTYSPLYKTKLRTLDMVE